MKGIRRAKFIIIALLVNISILNITAPLFAKYPIKLTISEGYIEPQITLSFIIRLIVIAPIWEIFVFQVILIGIINFIIMIISKENKIRATSIIVSALLFVLVHFFDYDTNIIKFLSTFLTGIILAYAYLLYMYKEEKLVDDVGSIV